MQKSYFTEHMPLFKIIDDECECQFCVNKKQNNSQRTGRIGHWVGWAGKLWKFMK